MHERVILKIDDRQGYAPDQITDSVTLGTLLELVTAAVEEFGPDAMVVLNNGDRYGATYGRLSTWDDLFTAEDADSECETCGLVEGQHDVECPEAAA